MAPTVSLSRAAQGIFQSDHYSQASRTMVLRNGRIVRIMTSNNGMEKEAPTHNDQHGTAPEAEMSFTFMDKAPSKTDDKGEDVHEPCLLGNLNKDKAPVHGIVSSSPWSAGPFMDKAPAKNADKGKDVHEPRLLGNLSKLAEPPAVEAKVTTEPEAERSPYKTEPDAEPDALADCPPQKVNSRNGEESLRRHEAEVHSLTAQLMDAKEKAERLKTNEEKRLGDVAAERERRREAEGEAAKLQLKCRLQEQAFLKIKKDKAKENARLAAEKADLERKLKQMHKRTGAGSTKPCFDNGHLATHMADAECGPLGRCAVEEKAALKKKLLLKWHPDKQPSADHSMFATRVMQEMQNCAEWRD